MAAASAAGGTHACTPACRACACVLCNANVCRLCAACKARGQEGATTRTGAAALSGGLVLVHGAAACSAGLAWHGRRQALPSDLLPPPCPATGVPRTPKLSGQPAASRKARSAPLPLPPPHPTHGGPSGPPVRLTACCSSRRRAVLSAGGVSTEQPDDMLLAGKRRMADRERIKLPCVHARTHAHGTHACAVVCVAGTRGQSKSCGLRPAHGQSHVVQQWARALELEKVGCRAWAGCRPLPQARGRCRAQLPTGGLAGVWWLKGLSAQGCTRLKGRVA